MKLIFVYNADSGPLNAVMDGLHKIVSPETYSCELCALTYGNVLERKEWKAFREQSPHDMTFLHRDEFEEAYEERFTYPVVLAEKDGELQPVLSKEQMADMEGLDDLIAAVEALDETRDAGREQGAAKARAAEETTMQMTAGGSGFDWVMDPE